MTRIAGIIPASPTTSAATEPFSRPGSSNAKYPASAPPAAPTTGNTVKAHGSVRPAAAGMMRPSSAPTRPKPMVALGVARIVSGDSAWAWAAREYADSDKITASTTPQPMRCQLNSPPARLCRTLHAPRKAGNSTKLPMSRFALNSLRAHRRIGSCRSAIANSKPCSCGRKAMS